MIKFASLNLVIQMLPFVKFLRWSLYSTPQKWPAHHLIPSLNRPQVSVSYLQDSPPWIQLLHQILPLWYWTRNYQVCINFIHPLPLWLRQSASMALLEDHPHWYLWSTGPIEHMDENNSAWSRPSLQEAHNVNKIRSCSNHHQHLYSSL